MSAAYEEICYMPCSELSWLHFRVLVREGDNE